MIPDEFVGAWSRRSIALGSRPPEERAAVLWVQGRSAYADLRVPYNPTDPDLECFAGHTTWEEPYLFWGHDLDLAGGPAASTDAGAIEWRGNDLIERGTFVIDDLAVPYVEVWHKLPGSKGRVVEVTDDGLVHVAVGDHELTVVDRRAAGLGFSAVYRRRGEVVRHIGPPIDATAVPA